MMLCFILCFINVILKTTTNKALVLNYISHLTKYDKNAK